MKGRQFIIADVFTDKRFGGNQLAVFKDGSGLESKLMQDMAREMNYSETTFLLPPEQGGDYRVRIFTPGRELPFAGHPVVGTAYSIVAEGMKKIDSPITSIALETGVGIIPVDVKIENGTPRRTTMTQPLPEVRATHSDIDSLASALSIDAAQIAGTGLPVETNFNGLAVLIVPVASREAVEKIKIDAGALERISNEVGAQTVLTFTTETVHPASTVHCRVFAPAAGVIEDAATGSANGPLGAYLVRHKIAATPPMTAIISEQGFEMQRPSIIFIDVESGEGGSVNRVRVGGDVVIAGRGEIFAD